LIESGLPNKYGNLNLEIHNSIFTIDEYTGEPKKLKKTNSNTQKMLKVRGGFSDNYSYNYSNYAAYNTKCSMPQLSCQNNSKCEPEFENSENKENLQKAPELPPLLKIKDLNKYQNLLFRTPKKRMYIAKKDFHIKDKCYLRVRHGDLVVSIYKEGGWDLCYANEEPKKIGFVPSSYVQSIK
jgi:hypothetical protein